MNEDPRVTQFLEEILDSQRTPEEVCRSCPELLPEVRKRWQQFCVAKAQLHGLFPTAGAAGTGDPPTPGEELPRIAGYQVEKVLGRGGMGVVYKARHLRLNRHVAVKMMLVGAYADPQERARFQREAEAAAGLRHANIVQVHDVGDHEGQPYFTMEFVEGTSLAQQSGGKPQPARQAATLGSALAEAVQVAHDGGIVHRDLKPGNVLLTADGTPKISDFGLARRVDGGGGLTHTGAVLGTPSYMAPEQAQGKTSATGPAVDIYALGAILYELLTGRPPFQGENAAQTVLQVINDDPAPPSRLNAKLPRDLETVCLKCLHKDPARRYASAAALREDLQRFLQGEAILARPEGRVARLVRGVRRRPALAVTLAASFLLALALVGGGLWLSWERAATARAQDQLDRLDQARRDQEFATRLDDIHLSRATVVNGRLYKKPNKARADSAYEAAFREAGFGTVHDNAEAVAAKVKASGIRPALVAALDDWAYCAAEAPDRRRQAWILEVAQRADDDPTGIRRRLRDPAAWKDRAALTALAATAREAKPSVALLLAIGEQLHDAGGDAVTFLTAVQQDHPGDFWANVALGHALIAKPAETIRYYQAALALRPGSAVIYNYLGCSLMGTNRLDDAISTFQHALRIEPSFAIAHTNLAVVLQAKGRKAEAIDHFQQALRNDPNLSGAHYNYGNLLDAMGRKDDALEHFQRAVDLEPTYADAQNNLGIALAEKGRRDEAVAHFEQALALDPKLVMARCNLGLARIDQGRPEEAIEHFEKALAIDPDLVVAHGSLGKALLAAARFREARDSTRRCLDLLPPKHPQRGMLTQQLLHCERLLALEQRLPPILRGEKKPASASECLQFAQVCYFKKLYVTTAELYSTAFAEKPTLADNLPASHRYNAACAAALAGSGKGEESSKLSDQERARWRNQARAWLRADLAVWSQKLDSELVKYRVPARQTLTHWRSDPDLEAVRREQTAGTWSADEHSESAALWKQVDELLKRIDDAK
jgi:serine/threonine-protein kinase